MSMMRAIYMSMMLISYGTGSYTVTLSDNPIYYDRNQTYHNSSAQHFDPYVENIESIAKPARTARRVSFIDDTHQDNTDAFAIQMNDISTDREQQIVQTNDINAQLYDLTTLIAQLKLENKQKHDQIRSIHQAFTDNAAQVNLQYVRMDLKLDALQQRGSRIRSIFLSILGISIVCIYWFFLTNQLTKIPLPSGLQSRSCNQ